MRGLVALTDSQLDGCARLFTAVFNAPPWNESWTLVAARSRLVEILKTPGAAGLAWVEEKPVGLVAGYCERDAGGHVFYLKEMCVCPDWQRQGIGGRLLTGLEERLRKGGVRQIYLLTRRDGPAEAFYAANGFRTSGRMALMTRQVEPGYGSSDSGTPGSRICMTRPFGRGDAEV